MAKWAEEAPRRQVQEVRVLKVKELAPPQAIDSNPAWRKHYDETQNVPGGNITGPGMGRCPHIQHAYQIWRNALPDEAIPGYPGWSLGPGQTGQQSGKCHVIGFQPHWRPGKHLHSLYTVMMHWGTIIVPPGYTDDSSIRRRRKSIWNQRHPGRGRQRMVEDSLRT